MAEGRKLTRATKKEYVHRTQRKHTFGKHFYPKYFLWPHILCAWSISDGWTSYFWLGALKLKRKFARKSIKKARAQSALQHTQHTHAMCVCLLANPVTGGHLPKSMIISELTVYNLRYHSEDIVITAAMAWLRLRFRRWLWLWLENDASSSIRAIRECVECSNPNSIIFILSYFKSRISHLDLHIQHLWIYSWLFSKAREKEKRKQWTLVSFHVCTLHFIFSLSLCAVFAFPFARNTSLRFFSSITKQSRWTK